MTITRSVLLSVAVTGSFCLLQSSAWARVSAAQAAELDGPKLTCLGAERAGSTDGVAAYTGKYLGTWPGMKKPYGYEPGPYASEKPLFAITAQNMAQYVDKLTEGQQALLQKYPRDFRMNVYPSHRDFRNPDQVCAVAKQNAITAEVVHDGKGVSGTTGAIPFPIPQSGLEAIWNVVFAYRAWSEAVTSQTAVVYTNGNITWGKARFVDMSPQGPAGKPGSMQDKVAAYFYISYLEPERDKGMTSVGYQPLDFSNGSANSWQYMPGLRRVRQAPEVGFDYPVPPAGMHVSDEDGLFNGSPERFTWKIVGKKEIYVPYDNFRINDPQIKLADLVRPHAINPEYERYELHRVWVIEGTLKPGLRHVYGKRTIYADEDTWLALWADNQDTHGKLWRSSYVNYFYSQESKAFHRGVTVYNDLDLGAYEATYLVNAAGDNWWRLDRKYPLSMFTPEAAARGGH
ncbi:MAG: DUF1329 domain-containing protein [Stenotrophobium sp.]